MQLFVLKALSEGQPKHNNNGRKKFKGSKKYLKWSDSRLGFGTPYHVIVSQSGCSFAFPALSAGREVRYA